MSVARHASPTLDSAELARARQRGLRATDRVGQRTGAVVAAIEGDESATRAALVRVLAVKLAEDLDVQLVSVTDPDYAELTAALPSRSTSRPRVPSAADPGRAAGVLVLVTDGTAALELTARLEAEGWRVKVAIGSWDPREGNDPQARNSDADDADEVEDGPPDVVVADPALLESARAMAARTGTPVVTMGPLSTVLSDMAVRADALRRVHRRRTVFQ